MVENSDTKMAQSRAVITLLRLLFVFSLLPSPALSNDIRYCGNFLCLLSSDFLNCLLFLLVYCRVFATCALDLVYNAVNDVQLIGMNELGFFNTDSLNIRT